MEFQADKTLISACGLYCGTCRSFAKGKCPGCSSQEKKAEWCAVRNCCRDKHIASCAECTEYGGSSAHGLRTCAKLNSFMGKVFGLIFRSDRFGCVDRIREVGSEAFALEMAQTGCYNRPVKK